MQGDSGCVKLQRWCVCVCFAIPSLTTDELLGGCFRSRICFNVIWQHWWSYMYNKEHIFILREILDLKLLSLFFPWNTELLFLSPIWNMLHGAAQWHKVGTSGAKPSRCHWPSCWASAVKFCTQKKKKKQRRWMLQFLQLHLSVMKGM